MSCLNPITLRNPSKGFRDGVDKTYIQVPCGNCIECRRAMQDEWATRAYVEMQYTLQCGGFTLFPTLTYDNAHLPYFDSDLDNGYHIPCFSKDDIDSFLNTLRKRYERRGVVGIKYLICSEYGGNDDYVDSKGRLRTATNRPHYHCLIHFNDASCDRDTAIRDIEQIWTNGRVGWSSNGAEIVSFQGCQYVSKYITKDLKYAERRDLRSYVANTTQTEKRA